MVIWAVLVGMTGLRDQSVVVMVSP
jgi:hypothetical protein